MLGSCIIKIVSTALGGGYFRQSKFYKSQAGKVSLVRNVLLCAPFFQCWIKTSYQHSALYTSLCERKA
jgi:hypothetical protein